MKRKCNWYRVHFYDRMFNSCGYESPMSFGQAQRFIREMSGDELPSFEFWIEVVE